MGKRFMPAVKTAEELRDLQLEGLKWTVDHAYQGSSFYRNRLDEAGVRPEDIKSHDDLERLPFTTAQDLQEGYPMPLLSVPPENVVRVHASSGTTGKRKVLCYTQKDIDDWANMFARCYEMAGLTRDDRVQIAVGYGLWTAGAGFQLGCERFGALTIPVGPGNRDMHCELMVDLQSTVFCCTASMGLLMAEEIHRRNLKDKIALRKVIFGAERHSDAMRKGIEEYFGIEESFDIPGLTELYGPGTGLECEKHEGIHYWADYYILEIIDPETLEPLPPGETGEMVVTTLRKEAVPLIRYRTRDLTHLKPEPCSCGSVLPQHGPLLGRTDDMFIIRGVNIYPGQIDHLLSQDDKIGSEYQVFLTRGDGQDHMTIHVERGESADPDEDSAVTARLGDAMQLHLLVRAQVKVVDHGNLPRTERKSKRVFDERG
ncbi:MAG: phenylacetate--CoA ligase [Deltaproteobacteria bacterium]|nr:phenylacetate--CoA ligase [Deltaproteobacteria bacterium]MBW2172295.1 phenylacetate--CoA ligase [Deltaproteobacteria bacterium]